MARPEEEKLEKPKGDETWLNPIMTKNPLQQGRYWQSGRIRQPFWMTEESIIPRYPILQAGEKVPETRPINPQPSAYQNLYQQFGQAPRPDPNTFLKVLFGSGILTEHQMDLIRALMADPAAFQAPAQTPAGATEQLTPSIV